MMNGRLSSIAYWKRVCVEKKGEVGEERIKREGEEGEGGGEKEK